jgi:hypothetical protein
MIDFTAASREGWLSNCECRKERKLGSKRREFRPATVKLSLAVEISKTSLYVV